MELVLDGGTKAEACAMSVVSSVTSWSQTTGSGSLTCKNQVILNPAKMVIVRDNLLSKHPPGQSWYPGEKNRSGQLRPDPLLLDLDGITLIYSVIRPIHNIVCTYLFAGSLMGQRCSHVDLNHRQVEFVS